MVINVFNIQVDCQDNQLHMRKRTKNSEKRSFVKPGVIKLASRKIALSAAIMPPEYDPTTKSEISVNVKERIKFEYQASLEDKLQAQLV
ncbi:hypothetical protein RUM43_003308 [Polyplax serrata]|uniref:Uncharacterized protein n=1 Tax=Polyplax serrata TaxID=468196 RepID=A0AAN8P1Z5_POLSC